MKAFLIALLMSFAGALAPAAQAQEMVSAEPYAAAVLKECQPFLEGLFHDDTAAIAQHLSPLVWQKEGREKFLLSVAKEKQYALPPDYYHIFTLENPAQAQVIGAEVRLLLTVQSSVMKKPETELGKAALIVIALSSDEGQSWKFVPLTSPKIRNAVLPHLEKWAEQGLPVPLH